MKSYYDGNFFRAKGRNAKTFSSVKLTKEQIADGDFVFQDDEQEDAIRNIEGAVGTEAGANEEGAFYAARPAKKPVESWQTDSVNFLTAGLYFDASRVVHTAEENRSRNLTFTIWVLEKD